MYDNTKNQFLINLLTKVLFYLRMLKRVASDMGNDNLVNDLHVTCVEVDSLRDKLCEEKFQKPKEENNEATV